MNVHVRTRLRWAVLGGILTTLSVSVAAPGAGAATVTPSACGTSATSAPRVVGGTLDTRFTDAWRQFGNSGGGWADRRGWGASDGTYSTEFPGHRVVWLLNDTFMGPVNDDESLPLDTAFVHNSAVLGGRDGLPDTTVTAGTHEHPESLVGPTVTAPPWDPSGTNDHWYWNGDGIIDGGKLRVMEYAQRPTDGPPPFNFEWTGTDIATFSKDLRLESVTPSYSQDGVSWGVELMRCGGYTYIYGAEGVPFNKYMHVARARVGHLADQNWEFFTGTGWSHDPTASARVLGNVGSSYSVTPVDGHYVLTTSDATLGDKIYVATADSPTGPFTGWKAVYTAPEAGNGIYAPYNIAAHPELSDPGELVISYNVNTWSIYDIYANANNNRPRFLDLHFADDGR
jgi:Domain of unknown function (DUF5005)